MKNAMEHAIFSTVPLSTEGYEDGKPKQSSGTGFLYGFQHSDGKQGVVIATARHNLQGSHSASFFFTASKDGEADIGKIIRLSWTH